MSEDHLHTATLLVDAGKGKLMCFLMVHQSDWQSKRVEFVMWASEVKGIDAEQIPRTEEKELFKDYIEDYNTGQTP